MKYYCVDNILENNTIYNFILGGRANGKSTGVLRRLIDDYFKSGKKSQFGLIRRYKIDNFYLTNYISAYLNDYCISEYESFIEYSAGKFFVKSSDGKKTIGIIGYVFCISDINNIKSTQYDYVDSVLFDEFIPMTYGEMVNGNNEPTLLIHILSTVFRHRSQVRVFLVANTITKNNCYFDYFKVDLNMIKCDVGIYKLSDFVSIEFVQSAYENDDEIPMYLKCIDDTSFTTGEFKTPYNIIEPKNINTKKCSLIGQVKAKEKKYYVYKVNAYDDFFYYFSNKQLLKNNKQIVKVITYDDIVEYVRTGTTEFELKHIQKALKELKSILRTNIINPTRYLYSYSTNYNLSSVEFSTTKLSKDKVYIFNLLDINKECYYSDGIILSVIENIKNMSKRY